MLRRLCISAAATVLFSTASMFGAVAPLHAAEEVTITATLAGGYSPKAVTVPTGTTVTWENGEAVPPLNTGPTGPIAITHRVQSSDGSLDTGDLTPGKTFTRTFNEAITLTYVCKVHPQLMSGSLTVEGTPVVPPATEKTIQITEPSSQTSSWGFDPNELTVTTGTTITWRNTGGAPHTVTADNGTFDSGSIAPGETWVKTFKNAVAVTYKCTPHPWMTATLVVAKPGEKPPVIKPEPRPDPVDNGSKPQPPAVVDSSDRDSAEPMTFDAQIIEGSISDPDSWTYAPETLTVREGDTVRWSNEGSIQHTVTGGVLDSGMLDPGAVFSFTFDQIGTITFACVPHPWMTGAVQVVEAGAAPVDLPPAPVVPDPVVAPPGGSTGEPPSGSDGPGGSSSDASGSGQDAWSLGHVPLAAGTSVALLTIGFLFALPLAHELRKQATQRRAIDEAVEPSETVELMDPALVEPEMVADLAPRAPAPRRAQRTVVATAKVSAGSKPSAARSPSAARARAKASATKTERIVLDDAPVRASRAKVKGLAGTTRTR